MASETPTTVFRQAGYLGLNFALMDGTAAYHNSVDTAERLDKAGLQYLGSNMLDLAPGIRRS